MSLFATRKNSKPPRPYQDEFHRGVVESWKNNRAVLAVLPTGGGKTYCANRIMDEHIHDKSGKRCLVLAHTRKLVTQFAKASEDDFGLHVSIESGSSTCDPDSPIVCATVQSISRRIQTDKRFHPESFDRIVIDEAHRALSPGYVSIDKHFKNAKVLGITATPSRTDLKDLMSFFDDRAVDIPLQRLIKEGYLVHPVIENFPITIRVSKEGNTKDFTEKDVGHAIEPYLENCAYELSKRIGNRCTLVFLPLIETSIKFCGMLQKLGVRAAHISGDTPEDEQREIERRLSLGEIQVVCNSMLWTEGVDIKMVSCILNLRLTESWTLYTQICGRGTRTFDPDKDGPENGVTWSSLGCKWKKKTDLLLLDPLWQCDKHSLFQRPANLFARDEAEIEEMEAIIKKSGGGPVDLMEACTAARESRESKLEEELRKLASRNARKIKAMELFANIGRPDLIDFDAKSKASAAGMSDQQIVALVKADIDIGTVKNSGHAAEILKALIDRSNSGLPSIKAAKYAFSLGMHNAWTASKSDVSRWIDSHKDLSPGQILMSGRSAILPSSNGYGDMP